MDITNYKCSSCSYTSDCYIILKHHIKVSHEAGNSTNFNETFDGDTNFCSCADCKYESELRAALSGYFQSQQKTQIATVPGDNNGIINFVDVGNMEVVAPVDDHDVEAEEAAREISAASFLEDEIRIEVIESEEDKSEDVQVGEGQIILLQQDRMEDDDSGGTENNNFTGGAKSKKLLNEHGNIEVHVLGNKRDPDEGNGAK